MELKTNLVGFFFSIVQKLHAVMYNHVNTKGHDDDGVVIVCEDTNQ